MTTKKGYQAWPAGPPSYTQAQCPPDQDLTHIPDWNYFLFDCFTPGSICLTSCCLPCMTFGKTQARVKNPTLEKFSYCNSDCGLFTCLGFIWSHWILQTIRRSELREQFGIKGNCCGDCCTVFCCSCCVIIQEEKEAELRTRPACQAAYQAVPGMAFSQ